MNNKRNIIITKILGTVLLIAFAASLIAHGGFEHVIGTVAGVSGNVLTVKTAKGNVEVKLNDKTEISKDDKKGMAADLKPGTRVVIDIPEGSKDHVAHSVKIGTVSATAHGDHPK